MDKNGQWQYIIVELHIIAINEKNDSFRWYEIGKDISYSSKKEMLEYYDSEGWELVSTSSYPVFVPELENGVIKNFYYRSDREAFYFRKPHAKTQIGT
jgi:hypothetical protein